jgi:hypothetical protein
MRLTSKSPFRYKLKPKSHKKNNNQPKWNRIMTLIKPVFHLMKLTRLKTNQTINKSNRQ